MTDDAFEYKGTFTLPDLLDRASDMDHLTIERHDCRTDRNRTGLYRLVTIPNSDQTTWVFDPMVDRVFLYRASYCQYCGAELHP
jgi:hypothetical protein